MVNKTDILEFYERKTGLPARQATWLNSQNNLVCLLDERLIAKTTRREASHYRQLEAILSAAKASFGFPRLIAHEAIGGGAFLAMYEAVGGEPVKVFGDAGQAVWLEAGRVLREIHAIECPQVSSGSPARFSPSAAAATVSELVDSKEAYCALVPQVLSKQEFGRMCAALANLAGTSRVRASLLHGDYVLKNLLFKNGKLSGVLDWEGAQAGDPLLELGYVYLWGGLMTDWEGLRRGYDPGSSFVSASMPEVSAYAAYCGAMLFVDGFMDQDQGKWVKARLSEIISEII